MGRKNEGVGRGGGGGGREIEGIKVRDTERKKREI